MTSKSRQQEPTANLTDAKSGVVFMDASRVARPHVPILTALLVTGAALLVASCFSSARSVRSLPPTDRDLWNACQPTLARICRATFEPTWDTCLAGKRTDYVYQPSFEARRALLLSAGCPSTIVKSATRRSREAVMPKATTPAAPAGSPATAPPPTAHQPPSETPS